MRFDQVNVFSKDPIKGNPVAVVHCGDTQLSDEQMKAFAKWTNLSETTFVSKSTNADYKARIWTIWGELPFAGHPTIGTAVSVMSGNKGQHYETIEQECGAGIVQLTQMDDKWFFKAPPVSKADLTEDALEEMLGVLKLDRNQVLDTAKLSNGPKFQVLLLDSYQTLVSLDSSRMREYPPEEHIVYGLCAKRLDGDLEVRLFMGPSREDPITGSLNACLGEWLIGNGRMPEKYLAHQGRCIDRDGDIDVRLIDGQIYVGGEAQVVVSGEVNF